MQDHTRGELGYHEAAKRLIKNGYTIGRPELDRGSDMIVCKKGKCIPVQIKTCVFEEAETKTTTWSGSDNKRFDEGCEGSGLIILALDGEMNHIYSLVFAPDEVPSVKSMSMHAEVPENWKYSQHLNMFSGLCE